MPCGNSIPQKVPFESYAVIRIKGAIIDEVRKHAKISRYKMAAVNQFYQARQELEQSLKEKRPILRSANSWESTKVN